MFASEIKQDTEISHNAHHLTEFSCRADMVGGVTVVPFSITTPMEHIMADVGEFFAWHAMTVHPHLKSFSGYDCITIKLGRGTF